MLGRVCAIDLCYWLDPLKQKASKGITARQTSSRTRINTKGTLRSSTDKGCKSEPTRLSGCACLEQKVESISVRVA